jgi:DNA-directed RNA polymerase subunit RPC12/RpoP
MAARAPEPVNEPQRPRTVSVIEGSPSDRSPFVCPGCGLQFGAELPRHDVPITCRCGHRMIVVFRAQLKPMS